MDTTSTSEKTSSATPPVTEPRQDPQQNVSPLPSSKRGAQIALLVLAVFLVLGILAAAIGFFVSQKSSPRPQPQPTVLPSTPTPQTEEDPSLEEETLAPGQKRYSSSKLGINFVYQEIQNDQTTAVKEEGEKIYVYIKELITDGKSDNYLGGQSIEIFSKNPAQSLEDAIKEKFLTGYSESDCFVMPKANQSTQSYPSSYQTAVISYPPPEDESEPFWANAEKCPSTYTTTNGLAYFLMDKNAPDRFAFLSIGQYAILSGPGKPWQDTVRFITITD